MSAQPTAISSAQLQENAMLRHQHVLICGVQDTPNTLTENSVASAEVPERKANVNAVKATQEQVYITENFCGQVFSDPASFLVAKETLHADARVYVFGNISQTLLAYQLVDAKISGLYIIKELSSEYTELQQAYVEVTLGQVPINVHDVGVLFRQYFDSDTDRYTAINNAHEFQSLTESSKPGVAYRKGIYLTEVVEVKEKAEVQFKLLRCSSNFSGPTDNFRAPDWEVCDSVNALARAFFRDEAPLNHVLAQTYHNSVDAEGKNGKKPKQRKAKIKQHSDKTKDMPKNALMAFVTFYEGYLKDTFTAANLAQVGQSVEDPYDQVLFNNKRTLTNKTSVLTILRFRLKPSVTDPAFTPRFDVRLYPNSVFLMSLVTNRLYTHEIVPSSLPVDKLPTRMGYVIRCSNTHAVFNDEEKQTYIVTSGGDKSTNTIEETPTQQQQLQPQSQPRQQVKLVPADRENIERLKHLYRKENSTTDQVFYEGFHFSLNKGDYIRPLV
jgi:hypothetical protein